MGTSTLFKRYNDLGGRLAGMSNEDLARIDDLSPWEGKKEIVRGWSAELELHNGNFTPLIWWYGRLMRLTDAPHLLTGKKYNKYAGKSMREYEWTVAKRMILQELEMLDKEFKRARARERRRNVFPSKL